MRKAEIYCNKIYAGLLEEKSPTDYQFSYDEAYVRANTPPVSLTLPKRMEPYHSPYLFPFFANQLPEGVNKRAVCRMQKIDENDEFGLLLAFSGKDFIGHLGLKDISE